MARLYTRRAVVQSLVLLPALPGFLRAFARTGRVTPLRRIGFFVGVGYPALEAAFHAELLRLGYIEGDNLAVETRLSRTNTTDIQIQAAELVHLDLELIVAGALPFALEVCKADPTMPMVIATCPGMVSNGFAESLEHPGGNATGADELPPGVTAKRLTLLKTAVPAVSRVALLATTPGVGGYEAQLADAQDAAKTLGLTVTPYRAGSLTELNTALAAILSDGMDSLLNFQGGLSLSNRQLIVDFAAAHHLPAIYQATLFAEAGGLMSWAPNLEQQYRTAAGYVDQILRGAKPGDLPITYASGYALTINVGAAAKQGLTIPPALLAQAARLIP
jgi:putative ABC transport system substrate-binding protein